MKNIAVLLFFAFIVNYSVTAVAQDINSNEKITQQMVERVTNELLNVDSNKWTQINNEWLFNDQNVGISPLFYTQILDSTKVIESNNGTEQIFCKKEIKTSSGYYFSKEPEWYWNKTDTTWYYKNQKMDVYPRTFSERVTEIVETSDCNENTVTKMTINIEKDYVMSSNLWRWDDKKHIWLLEKEEVAKLPNYVVVKAIKTTSGPTTSIRTILSEQ